MKKLVPHNCSEKAHSIELNDFCILDENQNYPSTQAAYKTSHIISDNQTCIYQSAKKDFSWTFLQKLLKLSNFPVPKDPCSKVSTFQGNKDLWEPYMY